MNHGYSVYNETPAPSEARRRAQLRQLQRRHANADTPEDWNELAYLTAIATIDGRKMQLKPKDEQ